MIASKPNATTAEQRVSAWDRFLKRLDGIVAVSYTDRDVLRLQKRLAKYRDGMFTFVWQKDVDPTNNHSKRTFRSDVINRKIQFHTMSAEGSAIMEIMLSIFKTLGLIQQDVFQAALTLAKKELRQKYYAKWNLAA